MIECKKVRFGHESNIQVLELRNVFLFNHRDATAITSNKFSSNDHFIRRDFRRSAKNQSLGSEIRKFVYLFVLRQ